MSTIKADQWLNSDGTENYKCRAWVNFAVTAGTPSISAAGNVNSITDNGVGDFTVNFTTAILDVNYAAAGSSGNPNGAWVTFASTHSTTALRLATVNYAGNLTDNGVNHVVVFR